MKILISNDDGVHAPGLLALYQALSTIAEVVVVAPSNEQSGCASSLSISTPLYTHELDLGLLQLMAHRLIVCIWRYMNSIVIPILTV